MDTSWMTAEQVRELARKTFNAKTAIYTDPVQIVADVLSACPEPPVRMPTDKEIAHARGFWLSWRGTAAEAIGPTIMDFVTRRNASPEPTLRDLISFKVRAYRESRDLNDDVRLADEILALVKKEKGNG